MLDVVTVLFILRHPIGAYRLVRQFAAWAKPHDMPGPNYTLWVNGRRVDS